MDALGSFFYGHPIFVWVPVHMGNHHVHVNNEKDWSCTYRACNENNLRALFRYHFLCTKLETRGYIKYLRNLYRTNRRKFSDILKLYLVFAILNGIFLIISPARALAFIILPGNITVFLIHVMNFIQHVDTDHRNPYLSCRNFVSPLSNFLFFNGGFHTVHHRHPALHWSHYPAKHREIAHLIEPGLIESDPLWYCLRSYVLGSVRPPLLRPNPVL